MTSLGVIYRYSKGCLWICILHVLYILLQNIRKFLQISHKIKVWTITALTGPLYGDAPYAVTADDVVVGRHTSCPAGAGTSTSGSALWQAEARHTSTHEGGEGAQHDEVSSCWASYLQPLRQTLPRAPSQKLIMAISIHPSNLANIFWLLTMSFIETRASL